MNPYQAYDEDYETGDDTGGSGGGLPPPPPRPPPSPGDTDLFNLSGLLGGGDVGADSNKSGLGVVEQVNIFLNLFYEFG